MKRIILALCLFGIVLILFSCGKDLSAPRPYAVSFTGKMNGKTFTLSTNEITEITFMPYSYRKHIAEKVGQDSIYHYYFEFGLKGTGIAENVGFKITKGYASSPKNIPLKAEDFGELFKVSQTPLSTDLMLGTNLEISLPDTLPKTFNYTVNTDAASNPEMRFDIQSAKMETLYGRTFISLLIKIKKCFMDESVYFTEKDILSDGVINIRVYLDDFEI